MSKRLFLYRVKGKRSNAPVCIAANGAVVVEAGLAQTNLSCTERAGMRAKGAG